MKKLKVSNSNSAKSEGYTQAELAAKVRRRAFALYEQQGRIDGHALEHWAQAEAELGQQKRTPSAA
jgi:Protein of unknown function (DUF2934)